MGIRNFLQIHFLAIGFVLLLNQCKQSSSASPSSSKKTSTNTVILEKTCGLKLADSEIPPLEPIVSTPLTDLSFTNLTIEENKPFPTLPLRFLTMSASVNDELGGYLRFTVQSSTDSSKTYVEKVPSELTRWLPNLQKGKYKVSAVPCNRFGCREDLVQSSIYMQAENSFEGMDSIIGALNECIAIQKKLQNTAGPILTHVKNIRESFEKSNKLNLASSGDSCSSKALSDGEVRMKNIETLGSGYVAEIVKDPDILRSEQEDFQAQNEIESGNTSTQTDTQTEKSFSKTLLFAMGVPAMVGGFIAFMTQAIQTDGWRDLTKNRDVEVDKIVRGLKASSASKAIALENIEKLNLPDDLKKHVIEEINKANDTEFKGVTDSPAYEYKDADRNSYQAKRTTLQRSAMVGGMAGIVSIGGVGAIGVSTQIQLASTDPLDAAANYLSTVVLPLQQQLRTCTVNLNRKVEGLGPK